MRIVRRYAKTFRGVSRTLELAIGGSILAIVGALLIMKVTPHGAINLRSIPGVSADSSAQTSTTLQVFDDYLAGSNMGLGQYLIIENRGDSTISGAVLLINQSYSSPLNSIPSYTSDFEALEPGEKLRLPFYHDVNFSGSFKDSDGRSMVHQCPIQSLSIRYPGGEDRFTFPRDAH